jgi:tetratricopeptide (TPR) repeat protein
MIERIHRIDPGRMGDADASVITGPYALTEEIEAYGGAVGLYPSRLFYPEHYLSAFRSDAEDAYSRHDWYSTYPTICLTMAIGRDSANLWGCLPRIKPHIEAYRIGLDRRNAPRSAKIIEAVLSDLPGEVVEMDDAGPEAALNEALRSADGVADYSLIADQNTILYDFRRNMLRRKLDCYEINEHRGGSKHPVPALVLADGRWRCSGSEPFSVSCTEPGESRALLGCCHLRRLDPPSVDVTRRFDEEQLLLEELGRRPDDPEPLFYLGQHAEDMGNPTQAIRYYSRRVEAGGENPQVWEASMRIAHCLRAADAPWSEVEEALRNAHRLDPLRPDPLVELGAEARRRGDHEQAVEHLVQATALPAPENFFYWDTWLRQRALEHLCVSGYYAGRFAEGLRAGLEALQGESAGIGRDQIIRNIGFYLDKVDIQSV